MTSTWIEQTIFSSTITTIAVPVNGKASIYLITQQLLLNNGKQHPSKTHQSLQEITELLSKAYSENKIVTFQLNEVNNDGEHATDLHTLIYGYNEESIIIDNQEFVPINDIQNISII